MQGEQKMVHKAIIKVNSKKDIEVVNEMILATFEESDIIWNDLIAYLSVSNVDAFQLRLNKLNAVMLDITLKASILILPYFDNMFVKYIDKISDGLATLFEVFVKFINEPTIKEDRNSLEWLKAHDKRYFVPTDAVRRWHNQLCFKYELPP